MAFEPSAAPAAGTPAGTPKSRWFSGRAGTVFCACVLVALNAWIAGRLFFVEFTHNWHSIEGAFIGMARYISRHWGDFSWWPIWHCGMPYQDTYAPAVHLLSAALATVADLPAGRAYHAVTGAAYALGPVTLFLMAMRLGAPRAVAFLAALAYSLFSPSTLLLPEFRADIGGPFFCRRLHVLTVWGEGPHITAMTLLPLAILALHNAFERRTGRAFALAAVGIAGVFLTNVPGTMATGLAVFCWLCALPGDHQTAQARRAWAFAAGAAVLAYGIACFGIPPSSLGTVFGNAGRMHGGFSTSLKQTPYLLPMLLAGVAGVGLVLARMKVPFVARFASLYAILLAILVVTARESEKFELLPQVGRLHLEFEMGIAILMGLAGWMVYCKSPRRVRPILWAVLLAAIYFQIDHYRTLAKYDTRRSDPERRSEFTTARWLDRNMAGGRVYATGSTSFWLNAFSDTPQLTGCCDQGQAMPVLMDIPYVINADVRQRDAAILWLQALGVQAIVVNTLESSDEYKDIKMPERFAGKLRVLHQEQGDIVYAIPQRTTSLAHILRRGEEPVRLDMQPYLNAIRDGSRPAADFAWVNGRTARIRARLNSGELVSVQVAHFNGWKAWTAGRPVEVSRDGIGFILIRPECSGECEILLKWTGPRDYWLAAAASLVSLVIAGVLLAERRARMGMEQTKQ